MAEGFAISNVVLLRASFALAAAAILINLPKNGYCITGCMDTQEVYDIAFNFRGNCSMIVNWTTPECPLEVTRYIVQSAQGCPSRWKSHPALMGNENSILIEDLALVTSCLLGQCYMRVLAEFDYSDRSERIQSHCVGLGDTFRKYSSPGASPKYYHYVGQQVCLPVRTICPPSTLPNFFINQRMIALSTGGSEQDEFYIRINNNMLELCINNHSETNLVIHEICHVDAKCSLCNEDTGELLLTSRTEVQTITSNMTTIRPGDGLDPEQELDCVPSIVTFCSTSYSVNIDETSVNVCMCLPLHALHGHGSDSEDMLSVELSLQNNSTVPGNVRLNVSPDDTVNLSPNMTSQCFNVDVSLMDVEYTDNSSLEMCLMLLGSTDATKCIHVPEPCVEIIVSNNTGGDQTTTQGMDDNTTLDSNITTSSDIEGSNNRLNRGVIAVATVIPTLIIITFIGVIVMLAIIWKIKDHTMKKYELYDMKEKKTTPQTQK